MLHSICQQIWKTQQWSQDWKRSVFILISKKGNAKECFKYYTVALISHASKIMLKILQARLQQYVNPELPHIKAGFRKGRGTRDQIVNIHWIIDKAREFQEKKKSTSVSLTTLKFLTVWIKTRCEKFWKRWEYQSTLPVSEETCMQIKKQQLTSCLTTGDSLFSVEFYIIFFKMQTMWYTGVSTSIWVLMEKLPRPRYSYGL